MSRQTVNLSKETTKTLEAYVTKRGMNNSSAIASMVSDKLDEWLITQNKVNGMPAETDNSYYSTLDDFRLNLRNQNLSAIAINVSRENGLSQDADDMAKLFVKTIDTIVPDGFGGNRNKTFKNIIADYLAASDYFQNWYQNYANMAPVAKIIFDNSVLSHDYTSFVKSGPLNIDIAYSEIAGHLINNYWTKQPLMLSNQNINQIKNFLKNHDNGLIVINGETGSGKTTLSVELSQRLKLDLEPQEVRSFKNNDSLQTLSTLHARDNESAMIRLHSIVQISEVQPVNLKDDTPILFIHVDLVHDESTNSNKRVVSDIEEAYY
mgnify:CR=1 FL=1